MSRNPLKIANAQAFWGDRNDAASELLSQVPDLDYLTLDYLAEVSLSILAQQRDRDPQAGYPKDFLEVFSSLIPYWRAGGKCRLITNAGGLNPHACAAACAVRLAAENGPPLRIGVVCGDDVLPLIQSAGSEDFERDLRNLDTGDAIDEIRSRLMTANAYLGAAPIVAALEQGADIVITGRVADPSLTVAPCVHHFQWAADDWDRWAAATVAGHLIECGVQVTGGISTDWLSLPDQANIGFPIIEMSNDGSFVVTKPAGTGGSVNRQTVTEQLVYEIGNPHCYLSPDLTVSFANLRLEEIGADRMRVTGAHGGPPSQTYKVSATYRDGFRAAGQLTIFGRDAVRKAKRCGEIVLQRLHAAGMVWRHAVIECLGANACAGGIISQEVRDSLKEVVLRIAMEAESRNVIEHFSRQFIPLVTAGPQGTTGYAEGRPRVHEIFRYWPCLIDRGRVSPEVTILEAAGANRTKCEKEPSILFPPRSSSQTISATATPGSLPPVRQSRKYLGDIAAARSGDKGINANVGVIARDPVDFELLKTFLTEARVAAWFAALSAERVERFELPNLFALNFVIHGILANSLRHDAQGKALGQVLLEMPLAEFES